MYKGTYSNLTPLTKTTIDFRLGYRAARYGGVNQLVRWLGYTVVSLMLIGLIYSFAVPMEHQSSWWALLLLTAFSLFLATITFGSMKMEKREEAWRKSQFLQSFAKAVHSYSRHPIKDEFAIASCAVRAKLTTKLIMPHPQIIKSMMVASEHPQQMETEGEKAWEATSNAWKRLLPRKVI